MLTSLFTNATSNIELSSILICTAVSILLGIIIAFAHKITSHYSKNFLITLSILPVLVQTVIIMVNGNLGTSVAIVGAFSLVKFRSLPGTSKEILSIFFAMTIGLATGMGHVFLATIMTLTISIVLILLCKLKIFDESKEERLLKVIIPENLDYTNMFEDIFAKYTKQAKIEHVKTIDMGSLFDITYRVVLANGINEKEFLDEIRVKNGNLKVILTHEVNDSEI